MLLAKKILDQMHRKKLSKYDAMSLLTSLIENCELNEDRVEYLEVFEKISPKDEQSFKFLENIFLSDRHPYVRSAALKVLFRNFPKKSIPALKWVVKKESQYEWHSIIFKTIIDELEHSENSELKKIRASIIDFHVKLYGIKYEDLPSWLELRVVLNIGLDDSSLIEVNPEDGRIIGLSLCNRKLQKIPKIINMFSKLRYLDLSYNKLTSIPKWICQFKDLKSLSLGDNLFTTLPECILNHKKLEQLDLYSSDVPKVTTIPSVALRFAKQKTARNYLQKGVVPNEAYVLGLLDILSRFSFSKVNPYDIRSDYEGSLFKLDKEGHVTSISMIGYRTACINLIPDQICELKYLEELNLTHNFIREIPESIGSLEYLKILNLFSNKIVKIPQSIGKLKSLEILNIARNEIHELPEPIGYLESLKKLNLYDNNIVKIPASIGKLKCLKNLDVANNKIQELPESIGKLKSLKILDIANNKIQELPESFFLLKSLNNISFHDNEFSYSYFLKCKRRLNISN